MQRALQTEKGDSIFLQQGDLKHNNGVKFAGSYIPFTNTKVMMACDDALLEGKKNVLLLDITSGMQTLKI